MSRDAGGSSSVLARPQLLAQRLKSWSHRGVSQEDVLLNLDRRDAIRPHEALDLLWRMALGLQLLAPVFLLPLNIALDDVRRFNRCGAFQPPDPAQIDVPGDSGNPLDSRPAHLARHGLGGPVAKFASKPRNGRIGTVFNLGCPRMAVVKCHLTRPIPRPFSNFATGPRSLLRS